MPSYSLTSPTTLRNNVQGIKTTITMQTMTRTLTILIFLSIYGFLSAQVDIDQSIQLTGGTGASAITGITDPPVNGTDAANKDYVDAAVAAGGGGLKSPTMMSNASGSTMKWMEALTYCGNLSEGGHDDWYMPGVRELAEFFTNNGTVPNNVSEYVWLNVDDSNFVPNSGYIPLAYFGTTWSLASSNASDTRKARCVR